MTNHSFTNYEQLENTARRLSDQYTDFLDLLDKLQEQGQIDLVEKSQLLDILN